MNRASRWRGPPLSLQIVGLLLAVLVVAQLTTLVLTLLLPPAPRAQYSLDDVAAMLAGRDPGAQGRAALRRQVQPGPPDISGPGWLLAERSRADLARLIGAPAEDVTLAFYTPLPFAGTASTRPYAMADDGPIARFGEPGGGGAIRPVALLLLQDGGPLPGGGPPGGFQRPPGSEGRAPPSREALPPGLEIGTGRAWRRGEERGPSASLRIEAIERGLAAGRPLIGIAPAAPAARDLIPGDGGAAVPALLRGQATPEAVSRALTVAPTPVLRAQANAAEGLASPLTPPLAPVPPPMLPGALARALPPGLAERPLIGPAPARTAATRADPPFLTAPPSPIARTQLPPLTAPLATPSFSIPMPPPLIAASPPARAEAPLPAPSGPPIRIEPPRRGLFGLAPAPFVSGDFIAALRLRDGRWAVVQPAPEPFPNSWQRRVLLWFALSLALVAPFGWLFARRLVTPLERFAGAAEQLGRDPQAVIDALDGPAEIGRAARAFNLMQTRLRTFVDDRTAMVGAISHDLRTPLTRMRFRLEDIDSDEARAGLLEEVDDMEAMIAEVIAFIRDATTPGLRERCDLAVLIEDSVAGARLVGAPVTIERADAAPVEVDVLGFRRLLDNLLENAVKYGARATVRLRTEADSAIAEVIDEGPGLAEDEIERVFEPFYRGEAARASAKLGSGLGLAVCRSIARAHGGDVELANTGAGLAARIRVPLAFGPA